MPRRHIGGLEV